MHSRSNALMVLPLLGLLVVPAAGQETPAVPLTLEEAQARALEVSHRIAEARARADAAESASALRDAADRPLVSASAGYTRTNHVPEFVVPSPTGDPRVLYPDVPNNYRTRIDLQWPIYNGGRARALERAAEAEAEASGAEVDVARADLRLEVARSFWALVTARATVAVLEQSVVRAQAHVRDARERLNAGLVPPHDVASAEAQASRQRMLLVEARGQAEVADAALARLVLDDPMGRVEPLARLEAEPAAAGDIATDLAAARDGRPERTVFERRIAAALESATAAAAARKPVVAAAGGVDYARPNPRIFPRADRWDESWDAGINVTWSLWDGGRIDAEAAQAASLAEAARRRLDEFDATLAVEIRQRRAEVEAARAAVEAAGDAVRAAAEAVRVVGERYGAGVISQVEVLDAQFALVQAELDRTRALANVRLGAARLSRAMGR